MGRVLNLKGEPVRGVKMELWQANTHGKYAHPADTHDAPLDPNFQGYAVQKTDREGRYRFKTIKPGAYPVEDGWTRPPAILPFSNARPPEARNDFAHATNLRPAAIAAAWTGEPRRLASDQNASREIGTPLHQ